MSTSASHCRFCAITSGDYALGKADQPWLEDESHMALTSIGAMIEGWTLVTPRDHSLNLLSNYSSPAFHRFVAQAVARVSSAYGTCAIFEHGGQIEGSATNCGTSHAHLHVVPLNFLLQPLLPSFDRGLQWFDCAMSDLKRCVGKDEYLFAANSYAGASTVGSACILRAGQSQFFRRVIAEQLGCSEQSDYRTHPHLDKAVAGATRLSGLCDRLAEAA
ncbi:hypothetical protein [Luteimonas notoginsengisoli]|uniref:HIT domain-containing protein n=1 Tax=Luteimonas notoginsengisoli TaxID=1578200 RepID=A0ABV7UUE6_9GAMM